MQNEIAGGLPRFYTITSLRLRFASERLKAFSTRIDHLFQKDIPWLPNRTGPSPQNQPFGQSRRNSPSGII